MPRESALSMAIALFHEPGLRHDWRLEPLPADIGQLLALVGGEPRRLEQAAAGLGTGPEDLLQAARFYVQEILLFADADDRRLLGLADGDGPETIRSHYRYLQSWLHPDRGGASRAETIHAARINAAWNRLRAFPTAEATTPPHEGAEESRHAPVATTRIRHWVRVEEEAERQSKHWVLAIPVLIALGGGWLWLASHPPTADDTWPGIEDGETAAGSMPTDEPAGSYTTPGAAGQQAPAIAEPVRGVGEASPSISAAIRQPMPASATRAEPALAASSTTITPAATTAAVQPSPPGKNADAAPGTTASIPPAPASSLPATTRATATVATGISHAPSTRETPAKAASERAPQNTSATELVITAVRPANDVPSSTNVSSSQPIPVFRTPATAASPPPVKPLSASSASREPPTAPSTPSSTFNAAPPDLAGRDLAAQQRGDALLAYLTRPQAAPPPIWRSGQTLDAATAIRRDLAEGGRRRPQVLHDQARWSIEPGQARLQVPVEPADRSGPRLLRAGLRWENDAWWVESIALEETR